LQWSWRAIAKMVYSWSGSGNVVFAVVVVDESGCGCSSGSVGSFLRCQARGWCCGGWGLFGVGSCGSFVGV